MIKPDYKGFCKHIEEWNKQRIPWGTSELIKLTKIYNTPIPSIVGKKNE